MLLTLVAALLSSLLVVVVLLLQALRVLNVSKRPAINDDLLLQLAQAAQPPSSLDTLDVSLTVCVVRYSSCTCQHLSWLCSGGVLPVAC